MIWGYIWGVSGTCRTPCCDQNMQNNSCTAFLGTRNRLGVVENYYGTVLGRSTTIFNSNPPSQGGTPPGRGLVYPTAKGESVFWGQSRAPQAPQGPSSPSGPSQIKKAFRATQGQVLDPKNGSQAFSDHFRPFADEIREFLAITMPIKAIFLVQWVPTFSTWSWSIFGGPTMVYMTNSVL